MANPEHLAILKEGVNAWIRWRSVNLETPDLSGADLQGVDLSGAKLHGADFTAADLSGANLHGTDLTAADLYRARLRWADLSWAILHKAKLAGAKLTGANLSTAALINANLTRAHLDQANLHRAMLDGADLNKAIVDSTTFTNVNLSEVKGLETIFHLGPSSVGIDTIYKSKGKIPHEFLRGCGVPENFIQYMASLVGTGIEFYSLFISYSHKDEEFAKRLHADLQSNGVRCWYAPEDMPGGKKLHEEIDAAIRMHDKLLLILSEQSMKSEWVKTEISKARKREIRDGKRALFPIRLCPFETLCDWECFDADTGKDSAREIREYFIPDFSNWKDHDAYKLAFDRLLKDLQGKAAPAASI